MPAKRPLILDKDECDVTPKMPAKKRITGTARRLSAAGQTKATTSELQTDVEKLDTLRSKLKGSARAFIKDTQRIREIVAVEGNSELNIFLSRGSSSADLNTELKRNAELTSRAELQLKGSTSRQSPYKGATRPGSSYEFLKSIMG